MVMVNPEPHYTPQTMFRWIAIVLLLCLPVQWSAAAAASPDAQTCPCGAMPVVDMACDEGPACAAADEAPAGCCAECGHGQIPAGLPSAPVRLGQGPADAVEARYRLRLPDPGADPLLRPPAVVRT